MLTVPCQEPLDAAAALLRSAGRTYGAPGTGAAGPHARPGAASAGAAGSSDVGRSRPTIGVAGPASGVEGLRDACTEAGRCLDALLALGRDGEVADAAGLGFVGLLLGGGDPADHVRRRLGPVLDYDAARGTDLVRTVETWLGEDRHLARTGERLHVHPNTVTQRRDRVGRLLGEGWQAPERLFELTLALRLLRVLGGPARS